LTGSNYLKENKSAKVIKKAEEKAEKLQIQISIVCN